MSAVAVMTGAGTIDVGMIDAEMTDEMMPEEATGVPSLPLVVVARLPVAVAPPALVAGAPAPTDPVLAPLTPLSLADVALALARPFVTAVMNVADARLPLMNADALRDRSLLLEVSLQRLFTWTLSLARPHPATTPFPLDAPLLPKAFLNAPPNDHVEIKHVSFSFFFFECLLRICRTILAFPA